MSRIGRSARTREQRLARRRADVQGFDRGGGRRSIFRSRYAKIFYVVGLVGLGGSLLPLLLLNGSGPHSNTGSGAPGSAVVRRFEDIDSAAIGAVEKPTYDAPPAAALDPALDYIAVFELESGTVRIHVLQPSGTASSSSAPITRPGTSSRASTSWTSNSNWSWPKNFVMLFSVS